MEVESDEFAEAFLLLAQTCKETNLEFEMRYSGGLFDVHIGWVRFSDEDAKIAIVNAMRIYGLLPMLPL